jgi:hypothetical protein
LGSRARNDHKIALNEAAFRSNYLPYGANGIYDLRTGRVGHEPAEWFEQTRTVGLLGERQNVWLAGF